MYAHFSNFSALTNHQRILLKFIFWSNRSSMGLGILHFWHPGDANAIGPGPHSKEWGSITALWCPLWTITEKNRLVFRISIQLKLTVSKRYKEWDEFILYRSSYPTAYEKLEQDVGFSVRPLMYFTIWYYVKKLLLELEILFWCWTIW